MRPVMRGKLAYESIVENRVGLADLALLNDAITVMDENERRARPRKD